MCGSCRSTSSGPPRSVRGPTVEQLVDVPRCPKTSGRLGGSAQVNWHRLPHSTPLITSYIYEPAGKRPRFLQPTSQWAHYHQWIALDRPLQLHQTHHVRHQLRIRPRLLPLHAPPHNTKKKKERKIKRVKYLSRYEMMFQNDIVQHSPCRVLDRIFKIDEQCSSIYL